MRWTTGRRALLLAAGIMLAGSLPACDKIKPPIKPPMPQTEPAAPDPGVPKVQEPASPPR